MYWAKYNMVDIYIPCHTSSPDILFRTLPLMQLSTSCETREQGKGLKALRWREHLVSQLKDTSADRVTGVCVWTDTVLTFNDDHGCHRRQLVEPHARWGDADCYQFLPRRPGIAAQSAPLNCQPHACRRPHWHQHATQFKDFRTWGPDRIIYLLANVWSPSGSHDRRHPRKKRRLWSSLQSTVDTVWWLKEWGGVG